MSATTLTETERAALAAQQTADFQAHNAAHAGLNFRDATRALRRAGVTLAMAPRDAIALGLVTKCTPPDRDGRVTIPAIARETVTCAECGDVVPVAEATFLPHADLCGAEDCEIRARRSHDGLQPDGGRVAATASRSPNAEDSHS